MTHANTLLAKQVLKQKGLNPAWLNSESPLCTELQDWIVDTLTTQTNMAQKHHDGFSPNPNLILLILGCCQSNFSSRNVDKFFASQDVTAIIKSIVCNKFHIGHSYYKGNAIEDPSALLGAAPSILFFWLHRRRGFSNKWMTFEVSQVMGNFHLWIEHRLIDHMKSKTNKKLVLMSDYQNEDYSNQNHEDGAQARSTDEDLAEGIDDALINASESQTKSMLMEFVLSIPIISIKQATSMIQHGNNSWNIFVKLNVLNLLQWQMANPLYCDDTELFTLLSHHAGVSISTITTWKNNLPTLVADIESSDSSQGTKAKEYTLLAFFERVKTIEDLRQLPQIKKHRETLRRRNNNTHAGVYTLCLLACLTLKGTNALGIQLLDGILHFYNESAQKIASADKWLLTEDFLRTWNQSESAMNALKENMLNVIAFVRYESDFGTLSQNKQANVFKILRIVKSIGQQIASNPSVPFDAR